MGGFTEFDDYVRARVPQYLDELKALIRQPTVSAQGIGIADTARIVLDRARRAGIDASARSVNGGPPTIVGETGRGERTLLVYNHYDVQPPDPLDEWSTPPFEPTESDGFLFGRGVSDNKGNLLARLQAIEAYRATIGELPLRIRVLYGGEQGMRRIHGIKRSVRRIQGLELRKKHFYEPTCTICGIVSGYTGAGSKTVLPAVASAKIDFRLVPDLTPEKITELLRAHLDRRGFEDVEIVPGHGEPPSRWPTDSVAAKAAVDACRSAYGAEPVVYPLLAGSGPMAQVCDTLGIPVAGFGSGNAGSANHAPNENIAIVDYVDHIRAFGRFLYAFAGRALA